MHVPSFATPLESERDAIKKILVEIIYFLM
jgi:hypothetical protein